MLGYARLRGGESFYPRGVISSLGSNDWGVILSHSILRQRYIGIYILVVTNVEIHSRDLYLIDPYKILIDTYNLLLGAKPTVSMDATECKQRIATAYKARKLY